MQFECSEPEMVKMHLIAALTPNCEIGCLACFFRGLGRRKKTVEAVCTQDHTKLMTAFIYLHLVRWAGAGRVEEAGWPCWLPTIISAASPSQKN